MRRFSRKRRGGNRESGDRPLDGAHWLGRLQEAQALEKTISASLDSAKKRTLGMKGGPEKRPKLETPAAVSTN